MTAAELAEQLAAIPGQHLAAAQWSDLLASPPEVQARVIATLRAAAVPPSVDYWAGCLAVLGGVVGVAGGVSGAAGAISAIRGL